MIARSFSEVVPSAETADPLVVYILQEVFLYQKESKRSTMPKLTQLPAQPNFAKLEEEILEYWQKTKAFERSVENRSAEKSYVFYDGPPFATGLPHYGHLLGSTSKDVIPRYWTMKGYRVERVWGWDCHGLPIEHMIEKQLGIQGGKKGIEELGIDKFNQACRSEVMQLDTEWEKIIARLGRWVDFKNNYKTMDTSYMESVWWGFKQLFDKGLIYEGRKVVMYCPRCSTPLSNFEIAMDNSYEDTKDHSVTLKFQLIDSKNEFFLAWTTTPWTLPGNVGLAVKPDAQYTQVAHEKELYWVAEDLVEAVFKDREYSVVKTVAGTELVGKHYLPLFEYVRSDKPNAWSVLAGDFVSLTDGTGIVHTAALFGEDDYALALKHDLPLVPTLDDEGKFLPFVELVAGKFYKSAEKVVMSDLTAKNLVFRQETIVHSYPFCYRCSTPLYYNAVPAWFIDVQKLKKDLLAQNEHMNWFPEHLKEGRFGKGLETAPDWNISRSRYWGTPMPVWMSEDKKQSRVIGSLEELQQWATDPEKVAHITDIHREFLDDVTVFVDDAKTVVGKRIPEVFDCWVESGSMPFASIHYPFENKEQFEKSYPAQFVSEYIAQTRAWFYTMHVLSVGIFGKHAVDNTLTTGTILAEDGTKMSKSKKNYPDPLVLINTYGVDSLRLYLMSSPVMKSENLSFSEKEVADIRKKVFLIWWNMLAFYKLYSADVELKDLDAVEKKLDLSDTMDAWIMSKLHTLIAQTTQQMDEYAVTKASREMMDFVNELSTWYLRRSRERLKEAGNPSVQVFGVVLARLAQLFAPFTPFFSELVWHNMVDESSSIHHSDWPKSNPKYQNAELETQIAEIRKIVEKAHALRSDGGIKVRQPLAKVTCFAPIPEPSEQVLAVLADEINVKAVVWHYSPENIRVLLDTTVTPELATEGEARELIRSIQKLRKQAGLSMSDVATVVAPAWPKAWQEHIERKTSSKLVVGPELTIRT